MQSLLLVLPVRVVLVLDQIGEIILVVKFMLEYWISIGLRTWRLLGCAINCPVIARSFGCYLQIGLPDRLWPLIGLAAPSRLGCLGRWKRHSLDRRHELDAA